MGESGTEWDADVAVAIDCYGEVLGRRFLQLVRDEMNGLAHSGKGLVVLNDEAFSRRSFSVGLVPVLTVGVPQMSKPATFYV
jgi:hypothetical protein